MNLLLQFKRIVLLGFVVLLTACGGTTEFLASIPEDDANEVIAVLLNSGISAHKVGGKEGMVSIQVATDQIARAVDVLRLRGLPRQHYAGMGDIFKKEGLISSPLEERVRYIYALSQELGNTISKIDGVIVARVHVVLPERGSAGDPNTPSSAAVFIKYQDGYNLDVYQPQIKRLVTNSIPNLTSEKVSVILVPSQIQTGQSAVKKLTNVMGFLVDAKSSGALLGTLLVLIVLFVAALAAAVFMGWKYVLPGLQTHKATSKAVASKVEKTEPALNDSLS